MFHLMLVGLPFIILALLAIAIGMFIFSVIAIVAAAVGGTAVAVTIKNKTAKKLLFIGFLILFLLGVLSLAPIITPLVGLTSTVLLTITVLVLVGIFVLTIYGIKISCIINNRIGKTLLTIAFSIILTADISFAIFLTVAGLFLTQG